MVPEALPNNASLADVLSERARRTPIDRLGIDIVGGALIAGVALWARPWGWVPLVAAAICFTAYGTWAVAERRLQPVAWPSEIAHEGAWHAVRTSAAFIGIVAFCFLLLAMLGIGLGPIKS